MKKTEDLLTISKKPKVLARLWAKTDGDRKYLQENPPKCQRLGGFERF